MYWSVWDQSKCSDVGSIARQYELLIRNRGGMERDVTDTCTLVLNQ